MPVCEEGSIFELKGLGVWLACVLGTRVLWEEGLQREDVD